MDSDNFIRCYNCEAILFQLIDDNKIKVVNPNGQDMVIGFNFVETICKKCGKKNLRGSEASDLISDLFYMTNKHTKETVVTQMEQNPYGRLSNYEISLILPKLSKNQKAILTRLTKLKRARNSSIAPQSDFVSDISTDLNLSSQEILKHINKIDNMISVLKPEFKESVSMYKLVSRKDIDF